MNEIDKLFEDMKDDQPKEEDIFNGLSTSIPEEGDKQEEHQDTKPDEPRKNRRHRRLEMQLDEEREARIRAETRAELLSESQRFADDTSTSVDERFLRIYGDTPETRQAWKLQQEILSDYKNQAKEEALMEIEERNIQVQEQTKQYESFIDDELENLEDEYNIDLTSDAPVARKARREFLEMVQQASPKDEDGTITGYADFEAVFEFYQLKKAGERSSSSRNRDISSRSMERSSGSASTSEKLPTPGFDGWKKDYGLGL